MEWKVLLYVPEEIENEEFLCAWIHRHAQLVLGGDGIQAVALQGWNQSEGISPDNCLLIAATDETLSVAQQLHMAALAYANPKYPNQKFQGVDMIVEGFEEVDTRFMLRVFWRYHHVPWIITETPRCLIRELELADVKQLFELYEKPGITEFVEPLFPWKEELEYEKAYIENIYRYQEFGTWLVFHKETGQLIGRAGFEQRELEDGAGLEMGYIIAPEYQNQGYATEVCQALMQYAWENLEYEDVNCLIQKGNTASIHLAEKLGFTFQKETEITGEPMEWYRKALRF